MTQLNPVLVGRFGPVRVMSVSVLIAVAGAGALLVTTITGFGGLAGFLVPLAVIVWPPPACVSRTPQPSP